MTKEEFEQLKSTVKQWLFHTGSLDPTDYVNELKLKFIEPKEKRIEELEKKNTELRRNEFNARSCLELQQSQDKAILNYMGEQLTKAKEIIKLGLEGIKREFIVNTGGGKPFAKEALKMCNDYCVQAEQFLKETE